jgi:aminomethyltransferase
MPETLLHTPLHDRHVELGARMVPFAGWEMPVQYEGVIPEHRAVRTDAGVFDVSRTTSIASRPARRNTRSSRTRTAGSSTT